ncbi:hypothetical protein [Sphingomonas sp. Leaf23]|uniref:hypothetical protein n=1 Tax=Sphingomonas sp. Leaf23 TaxID=1735689 RepID=UPI0012E0E5AF|nr:hypothetical protein [Sphingomonas sp. Leaf23]
MTSWSIYQELRGWQSVIGSVLGFAGLIAGALFNAHLNRKRDDRLRDAEAITLALSLYGEILLLRENIAAIASGLGRWFIERGVYGDDLPEYYREIFPIREPTLYNALAPKLGLLNPDMLLPVTRFYSDYEAATGHLPKLFKSDERKISYGPEWVIGPAVSAVEGIEIGLREIERLGGIKLAAIAPSLGQAKYAVELAKDMQPDY